jgi:hypothetical protein
LKKKIEKKKKERKRKGVYEPPLLATMGMAGHPHFGQPPPLAGLGVVWPPYDRKNKIYIYIYIGFGPWGWPNHSHEQKWFGHPQAQTGQVALATMGVALPLFFFFNFFNFIILLFI